MLKFCFQILEVSIDMKRLLFFKDKIKNETKKLPLS